MKRLFPIFLLLPILVLSCRSEVDMAPSASATETPVHQVAATSTDAGVHDDHLVYVPDEIDWRPAPASLESGAEVAVLEGDPSAEGIFTMRIRMPDGFVINPHTHPKVERVTVVSGIFRLGAGREIDPTAAGRFVPGSYLSMPIGMEHYAMAEGETVIQLTSTGPWQIEYVNPEDDPRLR